MNLRWLWRVVLVAAATVVSVYLVFLVMNYYGSSHSAYEPKDFERQQLYEQTGKSSIDRTDRH